MDSIYHEIFGYEDMRPATVKKTADLPMDSQLYDFTPATGAGDALCKRLESEAFTTEIVGPRASAESSRRSAPDVLPELNFEKLLNDAGDHIASVSRRAPDRARRIQAIIQQARHAAPASIQDLDGWGHLARSCETFVTQLLIGA